MKELELLHLVIVTVGAQRKLTRRKIQDLVYTGELSLGSIWMAPGDFAQSPQMRKLRDFGPSPLELQLPCLFSKQRHEVFYTLLACVSTCTCVSTCVCV